MSGNLKPGTYRDSGNRRNPCSQLSCSVAIIVPQHPTQPLPAFDRARKRTDLVPRFDELIAEPLVIPLAMIMLEVGSDSATQ